MSKRSSPQVWLVSLVVALATFGCAVNPQPDPALNLGQLTFTTEELTGGPGSVSLANASDVALVELGGLMVPRKVPVAADGSFSAPFFFTGTMRAVLFDSDENVVGLPIDFVRDAGTDTALPVTSLLPCARVEPLLTYPATPLASSTVDRVVIVNDCGGPLDVTLSTRRGDQGFDIESAATLVVPGGDSRDVDVRYTPVDVNVAMEELVIALDDGTTTATEYVTLVGRGQ